MGPTDGKIWYVRRRGRVLGPYPGGLIKRYILLGRIDRSDEISFDNENWRSLSSFPELIPDVLKMDPDDEFARQRLEAARRWADERETTDSPRTTPGRDRRSEPEGPALPADIKRNRFEQAVRQHRQKRILNILLSMTILLSLTGISYYLLTNLSPAKRQTGPDCRAAPHPEIVWNNCQLEGLVYPNARLESASMKNINLTGADLNHSDMRSADLAYSVMSLADLRDSDISGANLVGVTLRGAKLANVNFSHSDLSYANLAGADLTNVDFSGARLGNTIWVDGSICRRDSVGECLK